MSDKENRNLQDQIDESLLPVLIEALEEEIESERVLSEIEKNKIRANRTILGFVTSAAATGALPIPLADAPLLIGQQTAMLLKLTEIYGINLKKHALRSLAFTVLGISGTTVLGKTISGSLLKLIPGVGTAAGAAVNGTTAAVLTGALGRAYSELCQSVVAGDLEEHEMLETKGRQLLETAFRNALRLEMKEDPNAKQDKEDVLKQNAAPNPNEAIELSTSLSNPEKEAEDRNEENQPAADPEKEDDGNTSK